MGVPAPSLADQSLPHFTIHSVEGFAIALTIRSVDPFCHGSP